MGGIGLADSLILATIGWGIFAIGVLCEFLDQLGIFAYLAMLVLAPLLVVMGACFAVRDVRHPETRKQAILALAVSASFVFSAVLRPW
jgi:formate-dependent nitrite reductase membrane component NrfD